MHRAVFIASLGLAFAAGCGTARWLTQANAADAMMPQIIRVPELSGDALGPASTAGFRSKTFASAEGMTISVQAGNVAKHMHPTPTKFNTLSKVSARSGLGTKR